MASGHVAYAISALDLEMIRSVPPGGNWKSIPASVPSRRLEKIRQTGGRTTLYGRLRWDKPGYTITTYFNRPGNGCYIHPDKDRVLTSLEAARIQSFPDSYQFKGSKTSRTKQIGNAVPPLLAFAVAEKIRSVHGNVSTTMDLFAGAGGLTLGFKWAGFSTVAANDLFKEAAETYSHNHPEIPFVSGDIMEAQVREKLMQIVEQSGGVDVVMGGPPCQGFSNAGLRMIDDPRNSLYKNFVQMVQLTDPPILLMENVEGIMSINKGKTFLEIQENFRALGYRVTGRKLLAAEHGVPQKRKRVIIIGSKIGDPDLYFPEPALGEESFLTISDAIQDIRVDPVDYVETEILVSAAECAYQDLMQGKITARDFSLQIGS